MKKFKYILSAFLVALCVCIPFALTGCTRHYKAQVTVVSGLGDVRVSTGNTNEQVFSVVGETDVEKGDNFKYTVGTSNTDYEIWYINQNGTVIYDATQPDLYEKKPDEFGAYYGNIANVNEDISIKVAFRLKVYTMEFYYWDGSEYVQLQHDGSPYVISGTSEDEKTVYGMGAFGWLIKNNKDVLVTFTIPDEFKLKKNYKLYAPTEKGLEHVQELLGISTSDDNASIGT